MGVILTGDAGDMSPAIFISDGFVPTKPDVEISTEQTSAPSKVSALVSKQNNSSSFLCSLLSAHMLELKIFARTQRGLTSIIVHGLWLGSSFSGQLIISLAQSFILKKSAAVGY